LTPFEILQVFPQQEPLKINTLAKHFQTISSYIAIPAGGKISSLFIVASIRGCVDNLVHLTTEESFPLPFFLLLTM